jgi:hypothetical protein
MAPISDKQINFINKLLNERDVPEQTRAVVNASLQQPLDTKAGSVIIDNLLKFRPAVQPPVVELDGMYMTPAGVIYKVQKTRNGNGHLYAKKLVLTAVPEIEWFEGEPTHKVTFEYEAGAVTRLRPEWKMTVEQAKEFGALYGTCCACGRTLTNELSIDLGIGPICRKNFA